MDEEREQEQQRDEVKLPEERVEDLEPDAEGSDDVKGGQWWQKVEQGGGDG